MSEIAVLPQLQEVAALVEKARRILFITGAGVSADSGLPTYRGIGGLYNDPLTEDNISIEEALSGRMMLMKPHITWKYLLQVESACRGAGHNLAHRVISEIERMKPETWVLTQNIDGFHRSAGSRQLIEIHGNVAKLFCTSCHFSETVPDYAGLSVPPICPRCYGMMRPSVVLFGERLPMVALDTLQTQLSQGFDLVFSIGTTSVFPYIAQPVLDAKYWGAKTVEINPGTTEVTPYVDYKIPLRAAEALGQLWCALGRPLPAV
jgi:NAD-dependent deacetylase